MQIIHDAINKTKKGFDAYLTAFLENIHMTTQYMSYLLRIWLIKKDPPEFRIQIENSMTEAQHSFSSIETLMDFLKKEVHETEENS